MLSSVLQVVLYVDFVRIKAMVNLLITICVFGLHVATFGAKSRKSKVS